MWKLIPRVRAWRRYRQHETDLAEEIEQHRAMRQEQLERSGMPVRDAADASRRALGNVTLAREDARGVWIWPWLESVAQDVRYGVRTLRTNLGFTTVATLTLALGIGATTAIFSLTHTVLWKPLPVKDPEQLVFLQRYPGRPFPNGERKFCDISYPLLAALRERDPHLAGATTFWSRQMNGGVGGEAEPLTALWVADDFYSVLGVTAFMGRLIQPGDMPSDRLTPRVVLSHGYWERRFAGRPVVGSVMTLNGTPRTIVGVTKPDFFGASPGETFDVSIPIPEQTLMGGKGAGLTDLRGDRLFFALARLKPGVTEDQVNRSLTMLLQEQIRREQRPGADPVDLAQQRIQATTASRGLDRLRTTLSTPLAALMALVVLVLLIACANLAALWLSRATARRREMAIRASIGAGRMRLLRQLVTESLMLAGLGGALALAIAHVAIAGVLRLVASGHQPIFLSASLDQRALVFTACVSILAGVLLGVAPAWKASRPGRTPMVGRPIGVDRPISALQKLLVAGQVTLTVVLLVGAGLFMRSLQNLTSLDAGFRRDHVLLVTLNSQFVRLAPHPPDPKAERMLDLFELVLDRVAALPGVTSATYGAAAPLSGAQSLSGIAPPGYVSATGDDPVTYFVAVGPRYFETLGTPLVAGRDFRSTDKRNTPKVIVINETAARLFFPKGTAVGSRVGPSENPTEFEVIGVAADVRNVSLRQPAGLMAYLPVLQMEGAYLQNTKLHIRTNGDPLALVPSVRQVVREAHPSFPVMGVTTLDEVAARSLVRERLTATLAGCFGGLALLIAGVGLGGVLSYAVARRTNEIGIRIALGARRGNVIVMVLRESLLLVGVGMAVGVMCSIPVGRAAASLLFGLTPVDPLTLGATVAILGFVSLLAAYWPAQRAAHVDPIVALRCE